MEATAAEMNAQEVSIAYNACAKYDALGERLTPAAWLALALCGVETILGLHPSRFGDDAERAEQDARDGGDRRGGGAPTRVEALARAVVSAFPAATWRPNDDGDMQSVAVIFNALAKLDHAALAIAGEDGWRVLVAAAVTCARTRAARTSSASTVRHWRWCSTRSRIATRRRRARHRRGRMERSSR